MAEPEICNNTNPLLLGCSTSCSLYQHLNICSQVAGGVLWCGCSRNTPGSRELGLDCPGVLEWVAEVAPLSPSPHPTQSRCGALPLPNLRTPSTKCFKFPTLLDTEELFLDPPALLCEEMIKAAQVTRRQREKKGSILGAINQSCPPCPHPDLWECSTSPFLFRYLKLAGEA